MLPFLSLWASIPLTSIRILTEKEYYFSHPYSSVSISMIAFHKVSLITLQKLHDFALAFSPGFLILRLKFWQLVLCGLVWPPQKQSVVVITDFS